jgi:hypothetical protein
MPAESLASVLAGMSPAGSPSTEVRRVREDLASFLRMAESRVFRASGGQQRELRRLLGWDDESLDRFIKSPMIIHSSTHVSMNAFAPMLTFPWFCLRLITEAAGRLEEKPVHLRTQVTHNNLSDNRWKPHVWWRLDPSGSVARTQLFSKAPRFEHQILLCQPIPDISAADLGKTDYRATELARNATNFAYFALIYRMSIERACSLHLDDGTIEVPIDLMNVFSLQRSAYPKWRKVLYEFGLPLRAVTAENELRALSADEAADLVAPDPLSTRKTLICHNYINVGQAYRLGISVTMGAEKMSAYEPEMNDLLHDFFSALGEEVRIPQFLGVRSIDLDKLAPLRSDIIAELARMGGKPSFPIYADQYADSLLPAFDRALQQAPGGLASIVARAW